MSARRWIAAALAAVALNAQAGQTCEERAPTPGEIAQGMALAEATARRLDATGAQVVVLARAGQDLSRYGLRWSHLGFAYRAGDGAAADWRVVHKLNECGTAVSALYRQGLGEFFMDRPFRYEAAFVELSPELQSRLLPLLRDDTAVARWHEPRYSMVAYAWAQRYQQSNQWALETLAGAMAADAGTRGQAQVWLQRHGYAPTALHIGPLTRLGANVSRANVAFDDHPNGKRFADRIETVTVDSVFQWLATSGLGERAPTVVTP